MKIKAKNYRNVVINFYGEDVKVGNDGIVELKDDIAKSILSDFPKDWFDPENPPISKKVEIKEDDPEKEIKIKKILDENIALANKVDSLKKDLQSEKDATELWKNEYNLLKDKVGLENNEQSASLTQDQLNSLFDLFNSKKSELVELSKELENISEEEIEGLNAKELAILIASKTL